MNARLLLLGLVLSALLTGAGGAMIVPTLADAADEGTLSKMLEKGIEEERGVSPAIQKFAEKTVVSPYEIKEKDIKEALEWKNGLCSTKGKDETPIGFDACAKLRGDIVRIANREKAIRGLGRDLQAIASSYELPVRDGQRGEVAVSTPIAGIISVWRVKTDNDRGTGTGLLLRSMTVEASETEGPAGTIKDAYDNAGDSEGQKEEEQRALVWRYSAGVRLVRGDRPAFPKPEEYKGGGDQKERQYLFKRWEDVEGALDELWGKMTSFTFDPRLKKGEIVVFLFSSEGLPDNVEFWGFLEKPMKEDAPLDGDVGIRWKVPLDPVFPSIIDAEDPEKPIKGGKYPPPPVIKDSDDDNPRPQEGRVLCTGALAKRGYLCRTVDESMSVTCEEKPEVGQDEIWLTSCTEKDEEGGQQQWCCVESENDEETGTCSVMTKTKCEDAEGTQVSDRNACASSGCKNIIMPPKKTTVAGPDVCEDLRWTESTPRCATVKIECSGEDANGMNDDFRYEGSDVTVELKKQNNTSYRGVLLHALAHVAQHCAGSGNDYSDGADSTSDLDDLKNLPREKQFALNEHCCRIEGEAFAWQMQQMDREGLLPAGGTAAGVPLNATTLAEGMTHWECQGFFPQADGCRTSFPYSPAFEAGMFQALGAQGENDCEEVKKEAEIDPVIRGLIDAATGHGDICTPNALTTFASTIGNTACFIGACAENGAEKRRTVPGRTALTSGDEGFPFDGDLRQAIGSASFLTGIPEAKTTLPPYRPGLLLQQTDAELCQRVGLPPHTPSITCAISVRRQLGLMQLEYEPVASGLFTAIQQQTVASGERELLGAAQGMRIGTALYVDHIARFAKSFAEVVKLAERLMKSLSEVSFPTEMCLIGKPS